MTESPATTPIPVQLSEPEFIAFIFPHLSLPRRGPKCKLGYHRVFNLILWVLYTGMQWKCLPVPRSGDGSVVIHYTTIYRVFARWSEDGSLDQAFIASVRHLAEQNQLDLSILHGDASNTVAKKGGDGIGYSGHKHQKGEKVIAIVENNGFVLAPLPVAPVNEADTVLLPDGLNALKRIARLTDLEIEGAYLNLDGGFDSRRNRKAIFNAGRFSCSLILVANSVFALCSHEIRSGSGWLWGFRGHIAHFCLPWTAQRRIRHQYRFDGEPAFVTVFHQSRLMLCRSPLAFRDQHGVIVPDLIAIHDHPLVEHRRHIGVGLTYRERIAVAVKDDRVSACYPTQKLVAGERWRRGDGREEAPTAYGTQKVPKVQVRWPGGTSQVIFELPPFADHRLGGHRSGDAYVTAQIKNPATGAVADGCSPVVLKLEQAGVAGQPVLGAIDPDCIQPSILIELEHASGC